MSPRRMSGSWVWLVAGISLAGCASHDVGPDRFGVVATPSPDRRPCVSFRTPAMQGERVRIVQLPEQQAVGATVLGAVEACGFGQEQGHAYALELDHAVEQPAGSIAVRGEVPASVSFRACTGSESLHLTAWQHGHRIWHGFYDLGYDVEPDCRPEDIE